MPNLEFFLVNTKYKREDVLEYTPIHNGYTNQNYLIKTNDHKTFILRIPLKAHDFFNEMNAYKTYNKINFLDFNSETGVYVKEMLEGTHPNLNNKIILSKIVKALNLVHKIKPELKIKHQDWLEYVSYNTLSSDVLTHFYRVIEEIKDDEKTFTHHDLNQLNILVNHQKEIIFIDWEWARIDSPYFDYATLALNDDVNQETLIKLAKLDVKKITQYKFLILIFSHMWCDYMNTPITLKLKQQIETKIKKVLLNLKTNS